MKNAIVNTDNLSQLQSAFDRLSNSVADIPRMAVIHGFAGAGKTTGTGWIAVKHNGIFLRTSPVWTPSALLEALADELRLECGRRNHERLSAIVAVLQQNHRPVFLDDCDQLFLCNDPHKLFEMIRFIHDQSGCPVALVGQERFAAKLARWEQLARRISENVQFAVLSPEDGRAIADERCEVRVSDDLLADLYQASKGSCGRLVIGLSAIEAYARERGQDGLTLAEWKISDRRYFSDMQ